MKTGCYTYRKKSIREKRQSLEMKNKTVDVKTWIEWVKAKAAEIFPSGAKRQRLKKKLRKMEGTKIQEATHETFCIFNRLKGLTTARHKGWNLTHKTHLYEVLEYWWQKENWQETKKPYVREQESTWFLDPQQQHWTYEGNRTISKILRKWFLTWSFMPGHNACRNI